MKNRLLFAAGASVAALLLASPCLLADPAPPAKQPLDNPLEALSPKQPRSEEEEDRLAALAHFSAGHMLQERQQLPEALREYERAIRYDPDATPVLRELVPLAFSEDRPDEALRYAVKYVEQNPIDAELLQRAAEYLAESGQWQDALKLYKQAAVQLAKEKPSSQQIAVQMEIGRLSFLTEQYADAAAALKQVMEALEAPDKFGIEATAQKQLLGEGGATYDLMGEVFLEAGQPESARQAFEHFDKIRPNPTSLALNLARVELAADKPQEALAELQKYFDAGATDQETAPYEVLAKALKKLKQDEQLIAKLEAIRKEQPKNTSLGFFLGQQYLEAGQLDQAESLLEAAHAEQANEKSYRALADVYRRNHQAEKLLYLLAQMLEKTGSLSALGEEAKTIADDEKTTTALVKAAQMYHAVAAKTDQDVFTFRAAGLIAAEAKRWNDVETLFNLALKADPKTAGELYLVWGLGLFMDDKYAEAAAVFQRGIDEKALPDDKPDLYFYLAGALEMEGKTDAALAAAKVAADKDPKNPTYASRTAWIFYHAKRNDEAAKAYQAVLDKFDSDYTTDGARDTCKEARDALSNLCTLKNETPQAVEWLEQVLDEFPDDAGANNDLGFLWADDNQHLHRALKMIKVAVADEPDNYAYQDSLGWVLFRLGRNGEALTELQKAADVKEPDGEVLDHLGQVYAKLGQTAEAQVAWKKAAEAFKKAREEEKMKAVEKKMTNDHPGAPGPMTNGTDK
ncbi:MAG TPA: tetratricopeptide repeat protein [Pirellulales bacterium]|nr:tetratricopeptide repeat protein [Pirellulales bacterium]